MTAVHGQCGPGIELISLGTSGLAANHQSGSDGLVPPDRRISADGRYVAFASEATNPGDTNAFNEVFIRDLWPGRTSRVSVSSSGAR